MARRNRCPNRMAKSDKKPDLADFESAMRELDEVVKAMESGELTLEQSLSRFERGVALVKQCQTTLKTAELRIEQLSADGELTPLDAAETDHE